MNNSEIEFAEDYLRLESDRKYRNRWLFGGLGSAAITGYSTYALEGHWRGVFALVTTGIVLGTERLVLDAQAGIDDNRGYLKRMAKYTINESQNQNLALTEVQTQE